MKREKKSNTHEHIEIEHLKSGESLMEGGRSSDGVEQKKFFEK